MLGLIDEVHITGTDYPVCEEVVGGVGDDIKEKDFRGYQLFMQLTIHWLTDTPDKRKRGQGALDEKRKIA